MKVFSVWELTHYLRALLQSDEILSWLHVRGEVSNMSRSEAGHCYFTLKDGKSQIACVLFAGRASRVSCRLRDGLQVVVEGRIEIYEKAGRYQIIVEALEPEGEGALYLAFLRLKEKLEKEGLFDPARKRPLPFLPRAVGLVTSPRGAALHDMVTTLRRRFPGVAIVLSPSAVQGAEAPAQLIRALAKAASAPPVDVIILGRGGGSFEELNAFNDEGLARAVAACPVPVISAVGHETDFALTDFAADRRAPTPTGAAQAAVPDARELLSALDAQRCRIRCALGRRLELARERLARAARSAVLRYPMRLLESPRLEIDGLARTLGSALTRRVQEAGRRLALAAVSLDALSPLAVMARGYALLTVEPAGKIVTSCTGLQPGAEFRAHLHDGAIHGRALSIAPHEDGKVLPAR